MHRMMKMYWNWDTHVDAVVFRFWSFSSPLGLLFSCFLAAMICVGSQAIAGLRLRAESKAMNERRRLLTDIVSARSAAAATAHQPSGRPALAAQPTQHILNLEQQQAQLRKRPLAGSIFYGMQSFLSAIIMLILMTFNGYLIGACAFGSALGYHYFGRASDTLCH